MNCCPSCCIECGCELIDDAWEEVIEMEDGSIFLDSFYAWVCIRNCGFYIRKEQVNDFVNRE
jgi:hypothetical protein